MENTYKVRIKALLDAIADSKSSHVAPNEEAYLISVGSWSLVYQSFFETWARTKKMKSYSFFNAKEMLAALYELVSLPYAPGVIACNILMATQKTPWKC